MEEDVKIDGEIDRLQLCDYEKYPLKRLEFALNKIIKVTSYRLDMLRKQKSNLEKYQNLQLWQKVATEQMNASRTVQQLKSDIYEMERVGLQVLPEDLEEFDRRVDPIRNVICQDISIFLDLHSDLGLPVTTRVPNLHLSPSTSQLFGVATPSESPSENDLLQEQTLLQDKKNSSSVLESWERLKQDLVELSNVLHGFAGMVVRQRETVEKIDENTTSANENVREGTRFLKKAALLKAATVPLTGALVGCILAGPVGLIIGLKAAGACAFGGSIIGYTGGKLYQKRKTKEINSVEMMPMKQPIRESRSLSDLTDLSSST